MPAKNAAVAGTFRVENPGPGVLRLEAQAIVVVGPGEVRYDLGEGSAAVDVAAGQARDITLRRGGGLPVRGLYRAYVALALPNNHEANSASSPVEVNVWEDTAQDYQPGDGSIRTRVTRTHGNGATEVVADTVKQAGGQIVIRDLRFL